MFCPECGDEWKNIVIDSRHTLEGIRRRRKCECGARFNTVEILDPDESKKLLECKRCRKVVLVPKRRKAYCDECQQEVIREGWKSNNFKRKKETKKKESRLPELEKEAYAKGLSYGKLKGLKYLESFKEKGNEV